MIREVLRMGDPRLLLPLRRSSTSGPRARGAAADLRDTMAAQNGAGLAAPQIGVVRRVVIFGVERNDRYPTPSRCPTQRSSIPCSRRCPRAGRGWEGCLSVPGLRGVVPRFASVRYEGVDPRAARSGASTGFHARVVQHECDHLLGILYPMRMRDMRNFGFTEIIFPDSAHPRRIQDARRVAFVLNHAGVESGDLAPDRAARGIETLVAQARETRHDAAKAGDRRTAASQSSSISSDRGVGTGLTSSV